MRGMRYGETLSSLSQKVVRMSDSWSYLRDIMIRERGGGREKKKGMREKNGNRLEKAAILPYNSPQ